MEELIKLSRLRYLVADDLARLLREGAGLSLRAVAAEVGVSRPTLTDWERNTFRTFREREAALRYLALLDRLMAGGRDAP